MHSLRASSLLIRLILGWFVGVLGVAGASPLVHPQPMDVVCSATGAAKIVFTDDGQSTEAGLHAFDCPMCLLVAVPLPAVDPVKMPAPQPLAHAPQPTVAVVAVFAGAALPARGPPAFG